MTPYYEDDLVTLYNADCRDLLPLSADLLFSDPPYPGYEKGWEVPDVASILAEIVAPVRVVFWPVLVPSPLGAHVAEHVWHKTNGQSVYHYERILVAGDVARGAKVYRHPAILPNYTQYAAECVDHPTQKPLKLTKLVMSAYNGRTVIDPFAGSGTTLVAAKALGRRAIGVEIQERYCEIAARRLDQGVLDFGEAS